MKIAQLALWFKTETINRRRPSIKQPGKPPEVFPQNPPVSFVSYPLSASPTAYVFERYPLHNICQSRLFLGLAPNLER